MIYPLIHLVAFTFSIAFIIGPLNIINW